MGGNRMHFIEIDLRLLAQSPLYIGTGHGFGGILDGTVVKDAYRVGDQLRPRVCLPGSTLKGRLRHYFQHARQLLPHLSRPHNERTCRQQLSAQCCAECRVFGSKLRQGQFRFPDAPLLPELTTLDGNALTVLQITQRTGTRLSRSRRVVKEKHLYTIEAATEVLAFKTTINGEMGLATLNTDALNAPEVVLMLLACRLMERIGGFKTVGLGKVKTTVEQVRVNGQASLNGQEDVDGRLRSLWVEGSENP